ncbi:hypothetical protein LCGC14_0312750 [marine sediment metagenome]|uniref:ASCH domain-containing protein n=1 Tax=marine sediment metagenome TaxID=412755 RepID=A0A0F9WT55_9ZZZZ
MKIISFSYTVEALLAGAKTVTRRDWSERYARSFNAGEVVQAWDKLPRAGGKRVGAIRLTHAPFQENVRAAPRWAFADEGLAWMAVHDLRLQGLTPEAFWLRWREENPLLWVVRFELIERTVTIEEA